MTPRVLLLLWIAGLALIFAGVLSVDVLNGAAL